MSSSRTDILKSLTDALGPGLCPEPKQETAPPFSHNQWERVRFMAERAGARFILAANEVEAVRALYELVEEFDVTTAGIWNHPLLEKLGVADMVDEVIRPGDPNAIERLAEAQMGITAAHGILAESGSVLVAASPNTPRATSLLPAVHVAVVPSGITVPSISMLADFIRSQSAGTMPPSAIHAITGPSSTGDIEMHVVKGVHGPVQCIIVAIDE